jgi:GNAT superfamily N-acetyltransferase
MEVTFQQAANSDVPQIFALQEITWPDTYPNEKHQITVEDIQAKFTDLTEEEKQNKISRYQRRIADPDTFFLLAKKGQTLVGYCTASKKNKEHRIYSIYVLPEYQRQGIGSQLIQSAFKWLGNEAPILLNVASYNQKAINFYQKHGFVKTGKKVQDPAAKLPSGAVIPEIEMVKHKG